MPKSWQVCTGQTSICQKVIASFYESSWKVVLFVYFWTSHSKHSILTKTSPGESIDSRVFQKKQSSFLWPTRLNLAVSVRFRVQKMGLPTLKSKNGHHILVVSFTQKWWMRHLFHMNNEYHYRVSFGHILKIAYFRLIFGRFPPCKIPKSKPYGALGQFLRKKLWFLVNGFLTDRDSWI